MEMDLARKILKLVKSSQNNVILALIFGVVYHVGS